MEHFNKVGSATTGSSRMQSSGSSNYSTGGSRSEKGRFRGSSSFMKGQTSSVYTADIPGTSFQTTFTSDVGSDVISSDQTGGTTSTIVSRQSRHPKENVRLMPFKVKDVMEMIKDNPAYRNKSPVMIKVNENDIDKLIDAQNYNIGEKSPRESPISLGRSFKDEPVMLRRSEGEDSAKSSKRFYQSSMESTRTPGEKPLVDGPPFGGADRSQKVFAMPEIQAFPAVVGGPNYPAVRRGRSRRRHLSPTPRRRVSRTRHRRPRSRSVRRVPRRVVRRPVYHRRPYRSPCSPFPLCDNECAMRPLRTYYSSRSRPFYNESRVLYTGSRPLYSRSRRILSPRASVACTCNMCSEKLQFIQPGVCSKKKNIWTNEYAIIPKPQVNLIDPCEELDPSIYPRADNPCIRDGRGNPLTDCIGRPLRSPIGKKFLNFTANGSVMDTAFRGNFWTGQPPLCVKCPMPSCSCGPDTTHNWWMNCGYPILPNMNPFFKRVVAAETTY